MYLRQNLFAPVLFTAIFGLSSMTCTASTDFEKIVDSFGDAGVMDTDFGDYAAKYGIDVPLEMKPNPELDKAPNAVITAPVATTTTKADQHNVSDVLAHKKSPVSELFLRNVPEASALLFKDKFTILPNEKTAFFVDGSRTYIQPEIADGESKTFCVLSFTESGKGRRASPETKINITKVEEHNSVVKYGADGQDALIRVTKLVTDNAELRQLVCMGVGSSMPLSIGSLEKITGGLLTIYPQDYIDI